MLVTLPVPSSAGLGLGISLGRMDIAMCMDAPQAEVRIRAIINKNSMKWFGREFTFLNWVISIYPKSPKVSLYLHRPEPPHGDDKESQRVRQQDTCRLPGRGKTQLADQDILKASHSPGGRQYLSNRDKYPPGRF